MDRRSLEDTSGGPLGVFLHPADAVVLGYAMVDRLARTVGARCLAIKGPVPAAHGLRDPSTSVDVDVLVAPAEAPVLLRHLRGLGWTPEDSELNGRLLAPHSATLAHPQWPITIDLHHRFPGFLADPATVFEHLWVERSQIAVAEQSIIATGRDGATLIAALHALREPGNHQSEPQLAHLALARAADTDHHASLVELARGTGAIDSAASFLARIGIRVEGEPQNKAALAEWRVRTEFGHVRGIGWVRRLREAPFPGWPAIVWRALITDNEATLRRHGMRHDGSRRVRAHVRRIASVVADVPPLLLVLVWDRPLRRLRRESAGRDDAP